MADPSAMRPVLRFALFHNLLPAWARRPSRLLRAFGLVLACLALASMMPVPAAMK